MLPNDDLSRWGEPPADASELVRAEQLGEALERSLEPEGLPRETLHQMQASPATRGLMEVSGWIEDMMHLVAERAGLFPPDEAGEGGPHLRLWITRLVGGQWRPVASSGGQACVLRDLRRVPAETNRVTLHTGDRVRIEVVSGLSGYLTVFNVGPRGGVNVLYPETPRQGGAIRAQETIQIVDIELTPPTGLERVYAVWTARPVALERLMTVTGGMALRDMKRVQDELETLRPSEWHAILLELDHQA